MKLNSDNGINAPALKQNKHSDINNKLKMSKEIIISILNRAFLVLFGYLVAYMHWSLILPMIIIGSLVWLENKTDKISKKIRAKTVASSLTKDDLEKVIGELPSWVTFPDRERAEWLNEIVQHIWPNISNYIVKLFRGKLQTKIRKKFESFRFEAIDFGDTPPKIDGVKVYNKRKDSIIIDFDVFYDGDCDINFSIFSGTQEGSIKDFQLSVAIRVILKPLLVKMPLIGGIQFFFLNTPEMNFEIEGFSKIPGFSYFLRQQIEKKIKKKIVFPNSISKRFTKTIEAAELKALEPEGILRVHVFEAKDLENKDYNGKSDPYVVLTVGAQKFTTPVIKKSLNPKWDYWCEFIILDPLAQQLDFTVYDEDLNEDDFLGSGVVEIDTVIKEGQNDKWFKLEKCKRGNLHLRFTWLGLSSDFTKIEATMEETKLLKVDNLAQCLLTFFIDSARNLPKPKSFRKPDPYFKVTVGNFSMKSKSKKHTVDPEWELGYPVLIKDPNTENIFVEIFDKETETKLAYFSYDLINLTSIPALQISKEVFSLTKNEVDGIDSQIVISLQLRVLTNTSFEDDDSDESDDDQKSHRSSNPSLYLSEVSTPEKEIEIIPKRVNSVSTTPNPSRKLHLSPKSSINLGYGRLDITVGFSELRQKLIVIIHKLENLPLKNPDDIPDPYVKLRLVSSNNGSIKNKTKVRTDSCNPIFEDTFEYLMSMQELAQQRLVITVKSKKFFNSNLIGQTCINFQSFEDITVPHRYWINLGPPLESD